MTWKPPTEDGGSPILGYTVERRLTSSARWMKASKDLITELTLTVTDLIEDNEYEFRIIAENKIGQGPPSSPSKPFVSKDPWGEFLPNKTNALCIFTKTIMSCFIHKYVGFKLKIECYLFVKIKTLMA